MYPALFVVNVVIVFGGGVVALMKKKLSCDWSHRRCNAMRNGALSLWNAMMLTRRLNFFPLLFRFSFFLFSFFFFFLAIFLFLSCFLSFFSFFLRFYFFVFFSFFLDAPSHLYKRVCPSIRPYVGPSVGPSRVIFRRALGASCAAYPALFSFFLCFFF